METQLVTKPSFLSHSLDGGEMHPCNEISSLALVARVAQRCWRALMAANDRHLGAKKRLPLSKTDTTEHLSR